MNRKTVGSIAQELQKKADNQIDPIAIQRATEKEYLDNLVWAVNHARKEVECSDVDCKKVCSTRDAMTGDFYIVGLLKKERLLENVLRNYFIPTLTCPTPFFDQTVYKYNDAKGDIEFIWTVPDQETCEIFKEESHKIVPSERALLQFVLDYYDGTLYRIAKKLNGEKMEIGAALDK